MSRFNNCTCPYEFLHYLLSTLGNQNQYMGLDVVCSDCTFYQRNFDILITPQPIEYITINNGGSI